MAPVANELPTVAQCSWSDELLLLKYSLPKIWTQESSRPFGIYWSEALLYGRLWPEPTEAELDSFYDFPDYNDYLSGASNKRAAKPKSGFLSRIVVKIAWLSDRGVNDPLPTILSMTEKSPKICDLGCGSGTFLSRMRDRGAIPTGVDPNAVSAEAVRSKNIEFHSGTAEALPSAVTNGRFDVVSMFQCLEHCRDPALAVSNAVSLLNPNALLVIDVPNMDCLGFKKYGPVWWHTDAGRHLQFLTKASLTKLLVRAGAKPLKWEYQGFVTQFTQDWIDQMAVVWDILFKEKSSTPPRPSLLNSLSYLPRALLSDRSQKYEIIRVYAKLIAG
jgi:2-polyprenyl-3-methyl-5-hydroxy-6-metoxy-1,4-benzoquinol methylase